MKKLIIGIMVMLVLVTGCDSNKEKKESEVDKMSYKEVEEVTNFVKIEMEDGAKMILELYPDVAPITVANFQKLVSEKFYDGIVFHRIVKNFMIQAGDPTGTGYYGSEEKIKGEFKANGVENDLDHGRGVISMARSGNDFDSASSQFFIVHQKSPHLDGSYAAFGKLIAGFDTLDALASVKVNGETPVVKPVIKNIRFVEIDNLEEIESE